MIALPQDKIRQEINRIRKRLNLPKSITPCILEAYHAIERCDLSIDPLKTIPLVFLLYLNANDYFLDLYQICRISYISIDECMRFTEPLRRFANDGTRSQLLTHYTKEFSYAERRTLRFEHFRTKYGRCPLCSCELDEEYLRLFFLTDRTTAATCREICCSGWHGKKHFAMSIGGASPLRSPVFYAS